MASAPAPLPPCLLCQAPAWQLWAHATDEEYRSTDDTFAYYYCKTCDVLFIDPVPRDRLREIYPPNYYSFVAGKQSFVHRVKDALDRRLFARLLGELPGPNLRVLDVGGGTGHQLDIVKAADPRAQFTQVVDLDANATAQAAKRGHAVFDGTIEAFNTDGRFDLVLLLNLIEHVHDPGAILAKVQGLLSPSGVVLVKTPNFDSLDARLFRDKGWGGYHCPRHWVLFRHKSFEHMAKEHGLIVKQFRYTQGAPFWAQSVLFALARWKWISITRERPSMYHPLFPLISATFAAFDGVRGLFGAKTSQMFFVLGAQDGLIDRYLVPVKLNKFA